MDSIRYQINSKVSKSKLIQLKLTGPQYADYLDGLMWLAPLSHKRVPDNVKELYFIPDTAGYRCTVCGEVFYGGSASAKIKGVQFNWNKAVIHEIRMHHYFRFKSVPDFDLTSGVSYQVNKNHLDRTGTLPVEFY